MILPTSGYSTLMGQFFFKLLERKIFWNKQTVSKKLWNDTVICFLKRNTQQKHRSTVEINSFRSKQGIKEPSNN